MKKILIIANYKGAVGGISGQVDELYHHLMDEDGYEPRIYTTIGNPIRRVLSFIKLLFITQKYDVLHIHGCSQWGFLPIVYGVCAGKLWHKRIIITYHGGGAKDFFKKHAEFARKWLGKTDKVIVLNGYLKQVFDSYKIPCIIIPNCITLSIAKAHTPYQWNAPRFISTRHLRALYNIPCLLEAYAKVKKQVPASSLTILGDGPLRGKLEEWVRVNHIKDVRFVGQVRNSEMAEYLANSDIILSAPHIDNMPVSIMEAMSAGVLVISSRVGGVPYLIEDGCNGLLFRDDDTDELIMKIKLALNNSSQSFEMIEQAKQDVKRYTWETIRKQTLLLYEQSL